MNRSKSGWYYVGHGQLRFMDADGWTDQYRNIDNPPRAPRPDVPATSPPPVAHPDPTKRSSHPISWFVVAGVAAVTAVTVSASGAGITGFGDPTGLRSQAPRAQSPTAGQVRAPVPRPARSTPSAAPTPSISPLAFEATFNAQRVQAKAVDVIGDMHIVDDCLTDGVDVQSALTLLSRSYGRLAEAGVPPGLKRSDYLARVLTLQSQAAQAAEGYDADRTGALATYVVVRDGTGAVVKQINGALGSDLSLP